MRMVLALFFWNLKCRRAMVLDRLVFHPQAIPRSVLRLQAPAVHALAMHCRHSVKRLCGRSMACDLMVLHTPNKLRRRFHTRIGGSGCATSRRHWRVSLRDFPSAAWLAAAGIVKHAQFKSVRQPRSVFEPGHLSSFLCSPTILSESPSSSVQQCPVLIFCNSPIMRLTFRTSYLNVTGGQAGSKYRRLGDRSMIGVVLGMTIGPL